MISHNGTVPVKITIEVANRGVFVKRNWRAAKDWLWELYCKKGWRRELEEEFKNTGGLEVPGLQTEKLIVITSEYFDKTVSVWSSDKIGLALKFFDKRMKEVAKESRPKSFGAPARAKAIQKEKRIQLSPQMREKISNFVPPE